MQLTREKSRHCDNFNVNKSRENMLKTKAIL